ncbi:MAG: DNA-directed RNA polymerase I [Clostridia bacterium]|nr:DNA-directed RNA polymerase I [Clostridia bacterium]
MGKNTDDSFNIYDLLEQYDCYECGAVMDLIDNVLVCPKCGHSVDVEDWVTEAEDYEEYYPTKEQVLGYDEDDDSDE